MSSILSDKNVQAEAIALAIATVTGERPVIVAKGEQNVITFTPAHAKTIENLIIRGLDSSGKPAKVTFDLGSLANAGTIMQGLKLVWPYIALIVATGVVGGYYLGQSKRSK